MTSVSKCTLYLQYFCVLKYIIPTVSVGLIYSLMFLLYIHAEDVVTIVLYIIVHILYLLLAGKAQLSGF